MILRMIDKKTVKNIIEKRNKEIHKGDCGKVLIAAGSKGMAGAGVLCARGALRSGAGLVRIAVPEELFPIMQISVPEATCIERSFSNLDLDQYDAVAIGPGLGDSVESVRTVKDILESYDGTLVLDADGLNITAKYDLYEAVKDRKGRTVITPHIGEALRLLKKSKADYGDIAAQETRQLIALELIEKTGAVVVLKGAGTIVAISGDESYTNTTGNPGMATGGSGDVLCGIIAGLAAQKKPGGEKLTAAEAAVAGVFVHGAAGDLSAGHYGEYGLIAGDIADYTALAIKMISEES